MCRLSYRKAASNKKNYFVFEHRLADGEIRTVEVHSSPIQFQNKQILFSIIHDITDRHKIEEALIESEEKYRNIFKTENDALFLIDQNSSAIIDVNDAACRLYGYTREELLKLKNTDVSAEPEKTKKATIDFNNHVEIRYQKKSNGDTFPVDISSSIFKLNNRTVILAAIRDITERLRTDLILDEKSRELQKTNAEKDKFFSIIAHDLRSPFNAFLGFTELMVNELPTMKLNDIQKIAALMHKSAINLYSLLDNLLEWSLLQRGILSFNPSSFLVLTRVSIVMRPLLQMAEKKNIIAEIDIPEDISVFVDENMFGSILRNIAVNAIKFTPMGGKISLIVKKSEKGVVVFSLHDTGIGMSKEIVDNLFQLDNPTNRKGTEGEASTGLGLIICKEFIEKNGGKIWVESEVGSGSSFHFTLPSDAL